jgi:hypothetical protein
VEHIKTRLHEALQRGHTKVSEDEIAQVTAIVLAVVGELASETALMVAELEARVEKLEACSLSCASIR